MARPSLTDEQVHAFRSRATQVALEMFGADGYARFSLRTLASELGCSHATPYRYFPGGKEELFAAVRAEGFRRFAARLRDSQAGTDDPELRLRRMAEAYVDFAVDQPAAFAVTFQMADPAGDGEPEVAEAAVDAWSVLLGAVSGAVDAGMLVGRVSEVAHVMWAGLHGVASLELAGTLQMGRTARQVLHAMVEALLRAHRPQGDQDG